MPKLFFIVLILFSCFSCDAQEVKHKLIVNFNAHRSDFTRQNENGFKYNFWFPSIEYLRKNKKQIISFELAKLTKKKLGVLGFPGLFNLRYKDVNTQALLRFQYQHLTNPIVQDALVSVYPYYGLALTPHYVFTDRIPISSQDYGSEFTSVGITTHASLGMYCQFKKFFININTLWGLGQFQSVQEDWQDPSLSLENSRKKYNRLSIIPKDNLFRIGIGLGI